MNGTSPLQMYLIAGGAAAAASQGATAATGASGIGQKHKLFLGFAHGVVKGV